MPSEYRKRELTLGLNVFDNPTELIGKEAWTRLVVGLLFMRKGTYPSVPNMGIGIQDYEYEFMDTAILSLNVEIPAQVQTYLPDVPLTAVQVDSMEIEGREVLVIGLTFTDDGKTSSSAVAVDVGRRMVDFEIAW